MVLKTNSLHKQRVSAPEACFPLHSRRTSWRAVRLASSPCGDPPAAWSGLCPHRVGGDTSHCDSAGNGSRCAGWRVADVLRTPRVLLTGPRLHPRCCPIRFAVTSAVSPRPKLAQHQACCSDHVQGLAGGGPFHWLFLPKSKETVFCSHIHQPPLRTFLEMRWLCPAGGMGWEGSAMRWAQPACPPSPSGRLLPSLFLDSSLQLGQGRLVPWDQRLQELAGDVVPCHLWHPSFS